METLHEIFEFNESEKDFFKYLDDLPTELKIQLIRNTLIPLMNIRRGENENISADEIHEKLCRPDDSAKPGEKSELRSELFKEINANGISPKVGHELADIAYYGLQPNSRPEDLLKTLIQTEDLDLILFNLNITDLMATFCIIKYSTRLINGDKKDYKKYEFDIIQRYIDSHPILANLWTQIPGGPRIVFHGSTELFDEAKSVN